MKLSQKGVIPLPLLLAAGGILLFLVITSFVPFKDNLFNSLYPKPVSRAASNLNKRVLLIIYDPILSNGQKLHQARGWYDPYSLTNQVNAVLQQASGGLVNYQIAEIQERNEWPIKRDGFRYNETTYNACMNSGNRSLDCHAPDDVDYNQIWTSANICSKVSSGQIDEVILYGFPYIGFDELALKIPGDKMPYDNPTNYWFYQGRKKNIPDCNGKTVWAMGYSYERGVAEAVHSYGHRAETALALTVGRGHWGDELNQRGACYGTSDFDKFTCISKDVSASSVIKMPGCGSIHYPPNGVSDYDYANQTTKADNCGSWYNYPDINQAGTAENCMAWGCSGDSHLQFLSWWFRNLPKQEGKTSNGNLKNWWKYIVDFDNAVVEAKKIIACIPKPACLSYPIPCTMPQPAEGWCTSSPTPVPTAFSNPVPAPNTPLPPPTGNKISQGKPVTSSSQPYPGYEASKVTDGSLTTRWSSAKTDNEWLIVDLGSKYDLSQVILRWESYYFGLDYRIDVSDDKVNWRTAFTRSGFAGGVDTINLSASGRYVKFQGIKRKDPVYPYSIFEFEVYGKSTSSYTTPVTPAPTPVSNTPTSSNIALGKPAISSSQPFPGYDSSKVTDGNLTTRWSSAKTDDEWIYIDLGSSKSVSKVILRWESYYYGIDYDIKVSDGGGVWRTVYQRRGFSGGVDTITFPATSGRYVTFQGLKRRGADFLYSLFEFEVY